MTTRRLCVVQTLPALNSGGVERGTLDVAAALVDRGHRAIVVSAGGRLVEELRASGAEHIEMDIGKKSPLSLRHVGPLADIFAERKADIVHSRSRFPAWLSFLAWKKLKKHNPEAAPAFVTSVHGPYSVNAYSKIMLRGQRVIAISDFIKDYIANNYPDTDMGLVQVIHRGLDPAKFPYAYQANQEWQQSWRASLPLKDFELLVTLPARITRWKGQQDFILAVNSIKNQGIRVLGIVAGGVEKRRARFQQELNDLVNKLALNKNIVFCGHRSDLREIMSVSDIVFSLSREPEAFGRTSMEALALGKPVVAYDHGGASEVLQTMFPDGLVPPLDYEAAAQKAVQLYRNPPEIKNTPAFTLESMLDKTIELYGSVTSK